MYQKGHRIIALLALSLVMSNLSFAQDREQGPWWPHPIWGAEDQAGGSNWITPDKIMESLSLVKTGKVYELGLPYHRGMPLIGQRSYSMTMPGFPTGGPFENGLVYNDEFLCTEIGQVGTQFDGPAHIGQQVTMSDGTTTNVYYNGFTQEEMQSPYELKKLGVEHIKPIITRGVLLDVAGYKGVETLRDSYEITLEDVRNTLAKQGIDERSIKPGDAILFNTGWWRLVDSPDQYLTFGWAGLGQDVIQWIIDKKASMTGYDASGDALGSSDVHLQLGMQNGIFSQEFMTFETLLEDEVYEFLFIFTPIRFTGATGSPGRPIAIR